MNTSEYTFSPVIHLPSTYPVFDFSNPESLNLTTTHKYGVGRYLEPRPGVYSALQFEGRSIHMGVDIQAPSGTPVHSFYEGTVWGTAYNGEPQDYGYTLIIEYLIEGQKLWALYGHLNKASIEDKKKNQQIKSGQVVAWLGEESENGGWPPHLHFQLSLVEPKKVDMPGVVSESELEKSKLTYPDPRLVLGPIY